MVYKLTEVARIKDLGLIKKVLTNSFDHGLSVITSNKGEIISIKNLAYVIIQTNMGSGLSRYGLGSYVREGVMTVRHLGNFLIRNSPLLRLELAKEVANKYGPYFIEENLAKSYIDKASSEDPDSEVFHLNDNSAIPTKKFDRDKRALWLFQEQSNNIGRFMYDHGFEEMCLRFWNQDDYHFIKKDGDDKNVKPIVHQLFWPGFYKYKEVNFVELNGVCSFNPVSFSDWKINKFNLLGLFEDGGG